MLLCPLMSSRFSPSKAKSSTALGAGCPFEKPASMEFQRILCGLDIDQSGNLVAPSEHALEQASALSIQYRARLHLVHVLSISEATRIELLDHGLGPYKGQYRKIQDLLKSLCDRASSKGAEVSCEVLFGKPWLALVRAVLNDGYDLVLLGTAQPLTFSKAMFGGTSVKLVRKCPCPVWVTKQVPHKSSGGVLVAHCLTPVGSKALAWGAAVAHALDIPLRVVHALEPPQPAWGQDQALDGHQVEKQISDELEQLEIKPSSAEVTVTEGLLQPSSTNP